MGPKRKLGSEKQDKTSNDSKKPKSSETHRNAKSRRSPADPNVAKGHTRLTRNKAKELGAVLLTDPEPEQLIRSNNKAEPPKESDREELDAMEHDEDRGGPSDRETPPDASDLDQARQNTLQGLLRRLGAGFEDIIPHGHMPGSGRIKNIIAMMRDDDEMQQLTGLTELCEYISISTEDTMVAFPTEQIVPLLVSMLGYEHNPDLMLLAARALTFLADVFPPASGAIVRHGAVPLFCARLLTIEYIDLAEQSLQALEKLSHDHRDALLKSGALVAVLSYIDFFQTGVQRVAVATAANICRGVSIEYADAVSTVVPILINLLQYQDAKIVDSACLALTRIAESYSRNAAQMEMLCSFGLIASIVEMVSVNEGGSISSQLSSSTFYGLIKLLATCASGSSVVAKELLGAGVAQTLRNLMDTSPLLSSTSASPGNALRSSEQLEDLVALAAQILPSVPSAAGVMTSRMNDEGAACALREHLTQHPDVAEKVTSDLLPILLKVYSSSGSSSVKKHSLAAISRLLYYCPPDALRRVLKDLPVSSWVASLISSRDSSVVEKGLEAADTLIRKLPDVFSVYFLKEGVVHAMEQLASQVPEDAVLPPAPAAAPVEAPVVPAGGLMHLGGVSTRRRSQNQLAQQQPEPAGNAAANASAPAAPSNGAPTSTTPPVPPAALIAKKFLAEFFTDADGKTKACETEGVRKLKDLCARLPDPEAVSLLLTTLCATGEDAISTFELLSSGTLKALRSYLACTDCASTAIPAAEQQMVLLERMHTFARCALPPGSGSEPPLRPLVRNLLSAFSTLEKFAVRLTNVHMSSSYGGMYFYRGALHRPQASTSNSLSSSLAALTNPLKIRLSKASDEPNLRDHSSQVVLIEPLASMAQVEDFLWSRVHTTAALVREGNELPTTAAAGTADAQPPSASGRATRSTRTAGGPSSAAPIASGGTSTQQQQQQQQVTEAAAPSGRPKASRTRPIPQAADGQQQRRLTRAQARAAAEAEVANMERGEGGAGVPPANAEDNKNGNGDGSESDPMSEDEHELLIHEPPTSAEAAREDRPLGSEHGDDFQDVEDEMDDDEDDDEDGYVEGEPDDYDEDDDDMTDAAAMQVHDMHLAEGEEGIALAAATAAAEQEAAAAAAAQQEQQHRSRSTGTGHRSYARAAAGSGERANADRGANDDQQPRLAFYINGKLIPKGSTIFQAVQSAAAAAMAARAGSSASQQSETSASSRLWSDVHTLTYRTYSSAMQLQEQEKQRSEEEAASAAGGNMIVDTSEPSGSEQKALKESSKSGAAPTVLTGVNIQQVSPLGELIPHKGALTQLEGASDDVRDALEVLRVLEAINRLAPRLVSVLESEQGRTLPADQPLLGRVPHEVFARGKLGPKLAQQLKDAISICSGSLPDWCSTLITEARFLFPFEIRRRYFYCTALGLPRALLYLQQVHAAEHPEASADRDTAGLRIGRVQRQKVRISRKRLLDSAHKVFEMYSGPKSMLEIEFFNEVGTGLGPTLEFYTLLSHELQRKSLNIWRHDAAAGAILPAPDAKPRLSTSSTAPSEAKTSGPGPLRGELALSVSGPEADRLREKDLVTAPYGLFPNPLPPSQRNMDEKTAKHFKLLGRVVAKALQDQRLLDLPLSPVFYRVLLGRRVDIFDLKRVDPAMGSSLERLHAAERGAAVAGPDAVAIIDGASIEDLCLSFVLPGRPEYELRPNGADIAVTTENLKDYVEAVVDATLGSGVSLQVEAFRAGFEEIFPLSALKPFYIDEIEAMVCGTGESWTIDGLSSVIKFDHGYTASHPVVKALLEVLVELDPVDQRRFLRFVTGTPRLPAGGLGALQPRLTVVRKLSHASSGIDAAVLASSLPGGSSYQNEAGNTASLGSLPAGGLPRSVADGDLPSVMTCANYLKLPPYSTKEILKERLMFAVREGQGSFDLS